MNPIKGLAQKLANRGKSKSALVKGPGYELGKSINSFTLSHYDRNDYENAYPSIRVISQKFAAIEPYTIDKTGKSVSSNVLDRLYTPNKQMSAYDFREGLAIMSLVHNEVYLRVHHRTTRINAETITGFTFIEGVTEHLVEGQIQYWLPNGEHLTTAEVIVLKSINPYNLNKGFSPAYAARRWTSLDDLIADYQIGFFNNGAVPSGQFIITARTNTEYQDIANGIKSHHQGAGKNSGIMFAHRPVAGDGKPLDSQIEWVPFSTQNKDMALKDLFEQANKKIDSVYGVPASLRGVNDSNTYASVRVDQQIFVENTLNPFTMKIWQKFTHELNRITGGMGLAITYDLDTPVIADEEEIKAKARAADAGTVISLTEAGYTLESAIAYVESGNIAALKQVPTPEELPEVLDSDEAKQTPDQPADLTRQTGKGHKHPKAKALSPEDRADYEARLDAVVITRMTAQVEAAMTLASSKAISVEEPVDDKEDELLTDEMLAVLLSFIAYQGAIEHPLNAQLIFEAGIDTGKVTPFKMTGAQTAAYRAYVEKVGTSYNKQTADRIRNILTVGRDQGLTAGEMQAQLKGLLTEEWRIKRLTTTEINKAGNEASQYSMENIVKETGANVVKVWTHSGGDDPCEYCSAYIGMEIPLKEDFIHLGQAIEGVDGSIRMNDFETISTAGMHPHCHCRQTYKVIR